MGFDYAERRARLAEAMEREGVDLLFVPRGTDLEYLAGLERDAPTYGAHGYTHDWVAGAFFRPGHDPVFCLPRLVSLVHVKSELPGEIVVFDEPADGWALFEQVAARLGPAATVGVSSRAWAESVLRLQAAFPGARFVDGGALVGRLRMRKSPDELAALTKATQIAVDALARTTPLDRAGRDDARDRDRARAAHAACSARRRRRSRRTSPRTGWRTGSTTSTRRPTARCARASR